LTPHHRALAADLLNSAIRNAQAGSGFAAMIVLILLSQADLGIQAAFERYEDYQHGRGEVFMG
jgi:hypothetical protein